MPDFLGIYLPAELIINHLGFLSVRFLSCADFNSSLGVHIQLTAFPYYLPVLYVDAYLVDARIVLPSLSQGAVSGGHLLEFDGPDRRGIDRPRPRPPSTK